MQDIWFVRAGRESVYAEDFLQRTFVAIGWSELGKMEPGTSKTKLLQTYRQVYPDHSEGRAQVAASQIIRFMQGLKVGDPVMTHNRDTQTYHLGRISSECLWKPEIIADLPLVRYVDWQYAIPRGALSGDAKNTLGAIQTLFLVRGDVAAELHTKALTLQDSLPELVLAPVPSADQTEVERERRAELLEQSEQAIEDRIVRLEWEQVQELVAGVLRAMGYRTTVSPRGSDRGVDVFASPDGLGLEEPRIFVEVNSTAALTISSVRDVFCSGTVVRAVDAVAASVTTRAPPPSAPDAPTPVAR
jgi:restriction system protein